MAEYDAFDDDPFNVGTQRRRTAADGFSTQPVQTQPFNTAVPRRTSQAPRNTPVYGDVQTPGYQPSAPQTPGPHAGGYVPYYQPGETQPQGGPTTDEFKDANAPKQTYAIQPVDPTKWANPNHRTAKYDFLRDAQGFDPTKGITPELIAKLNARGYANFSGSGQRLAYSGVTDAGRSAGLDGDFSGDFIQHWRNGQNPGAQWAWDFEDAGGGTSDDTLNSMLRMLQQPQPPQQQPDMMANVLPQLLAMLAQQPQQQAAPPPQIVMPEPEQRSAVDPTFGGGHVETPMTPESPTAQALKMIAMRYPEMFGQGMTAKPQSGSALLQQILQNVGRPNGATA